MCIRDRTYIVLVLLLLSSCTQAGYVKGGVDLILLGTTNKTTSDHALSIATKKDCKTVRILSKNDVCRPNEYHASEGSKNFCPVPSCYPKKIRIKK